MTAFLLRNRTSPRFKVYDGLAIGQGPSEPSTGDKRLAAEAALACLRGEIVPADAWARMVATLEKLRA